MPDYRLFYAILCGAISQALTRMPDCACNAPARACLLATIQETEELYIESYE